VKDLGSGNFGLARLEREIATGELVAIKYIERGDGVRAAARARTKCSRATATGRRTRAPLQRACAQRLARAPPPPRRSVCTCRGRSGSDTWRGAGARRLHGAAVAALWAPTSAYAPPPAPARLTRRRTARAARPQIDANVAREIVCHRMLRHPNIVAFKEVCAHARAHAHGTAERT
jgi:hypothetical protein